MCDLYQVFLYFFTHAIILLNRKGLTTEGLQAARHDGAVRSSREDMDTAQISEMFMVHGQQLAAASGDQISSMYDLSTLVSKTKSTNSRGNSAPFQYDTK